MKSQQNHREKDSVYNFSDKFSIFMIMMHDYFNNLFH